MGNVFMDAFNPSLDQAEAEMTETWTLQRTAQDFPAISIDKLDVASQVMVGGRYLEIDTMIFVGESVFVESGVKDGDIILARGEELVVSTIGNDGDASRTLMCTGSQINLAFLSRNR